MLKLNKIFHLWQEVGSRRASKSVRIQNHRSGKLPAITRRVFVHVAQEEKQGIAKILAKIDDCCENQWKTIKVQHALGAKIFVWLWKEEGLIAHPVDRGICV